MKTRIWLALGALAAATFFASSAYLTLKGSVIVSDETGQVSSAVATNGSDEQLLYMLADGIFVGIQRVEGVLEVRCKDGSRRPVAYITSAVQMRVRVSGTVPCGTVASREWIGFPWK